MMDSAGQYVHPFSPCQGLAQSYGCSAQLPPNGRWCGQNFSWIDGSFEEGFDDYLDLTLSGWLGVMQVTTSNGLCQERIEKQLLRCWKAGRIQVKKKPQLPRTDEATHIIVKDVSMAVFPSLQCSIIPSMPSCLRGCFSSLPHRKIPQI
jgi:hypothetical protein